MKCMQLFSLEVSGTASTPPLTPPPPPPTLLLFSSHRAPQSFSYEAPHQTLDGGNALWTWIRRRGLLDRVSTDNKAQKRITQQRVIAMNWEACAQRKRRMYMKQAGRGGVGGGPGPKWSAQWQTLFSCSTEQQGHSLIWKSICTMKQSLGWWWWWWWGGGYAIHVTPIPNPINHQPKQNNKTESQQNYSHQGGRCF